MRRSSLHPRHYAALFVLLSSAVPLHADWPPPLPAQLLLEVRETAGVARTGELVRSGVPLPRELGVTDVSTLTLVAPGRRGARRQASSARCDTSG